MDKNHMDKKAFIDALAAKGGYTKKYAEQFLNCYIDTVTDVLTAGTEVRISKFGKYSVTRRVPRTGRNPKTGEEMILAASNTVKFVALSGLKEAVNK